MYDSEDKMNQDRQHGSIKDNNHNQIKNIEKYR